MCATYIRLIVERSPLFFNDHSFSPRNALWSVSGQRFFAGMGQYVMDRH